MMEEVMTTAAIRLGKLQLNCHHQHTQDNSRRCSQILMTFLEGWDVSLAQKIRNIHFWCWIGLLDYNL